MHTVQNATILIYNTHVITMNDSIPYARGLAIYKDKIIGLLQDDTWPTSYSGTRIDAKGQFLLPGLIDAHCHLKATLTEQISIQCPQCHFTTRQFIDYIKSRSQSIPIGQWIRITGYNPFYIQDAGIFTKEILDQISTVHPIRLRHVTRHATILNSSALKLMDFNKKQHFPAGMHINLDATGEPTGILYGADAWLSKNIVPKIPFSLLRKQAAMLHRKLLKFGITSVQDASPTNTIEDIQLWQKFEENWRIRTQFMTNMTNHETVKKYIHQTNPSTEIGPVKIVLEAIPDISPTKDEIVQIIMQAFKQDAAVAIHVVTPEMVWTAGTAIEEARKRTGIYDIPCRLEHVSSCPEAFLPLLSNMNIIAVTNPSFLYFHGDRYLGNVDESEVEWLYPMKSLLKENVCLAAGSDSPVAPFNPWRGIASACTRQSSSGQTVNGQEGVTRFQALQLYTTNAAKAGQYGEKRGQLAPNFDADFIMLPVNPLTCSLAQLATIEAQSVWIKGKCIF